LRWRLRLLVKRPDSAVHCTRRFLEPDVLPRSGASGHRDGVSIWWWEWSRCDHSARAERAARVTTGAWRTKPARRSARRDGSQREPFHRL